VTTVSLLCGLTLVASGCSLDGQVVVEFSGTSPLVVTESIKPEQTLHRVQGVTRRNGQVVGISCAVTMAYDVREATGTAVLIQRYAAHLRTKPLRRGTPYALDCLGALVVELPADAFGVRVAASAGDPASSVDLPVQVPVPSIRVGFGRRLRPEPRTQLALVRWPATLPAAGYHIRLSFSLPAARTFRQRAIYAAAISCGRSNYLQPILPPVRSMGRAPLFVIRPSAEPATVPLPRLAPGISSQAETTRTLACVR
jgi:hypothetical protein